jgi:hypothetical protein
MLKYFCCLLLLLVSIFDPLCVFADQITLKNGDRLTGKIVSRDADVITHENDNAGDINISAERDEKEI